MLLTRCIAAHSTFRGRYRGHQLGSVRPKAAMAAIDAKAKDIIEYWVGLDTEKDANLDALSMANANKWFQGGPEVDVEIASRFGADVKAIRNTTKYDAWLHSSVPQETVAGIILMDQFTRNIYRGTADMFCLDHKALAWSKAMLADGRDRQARFGDRIWILMPFMHSEDVEDQRTCVKEFERLRDEAAALGAEDAAKQFAIYAEFATKHLNVVEHWRRFPHRNVLLGRESTPEELAGLADGTIAAF